MKTVPALLATAALALAACDRRSAEITQADSPATREVLPGKTDDDIVAGLADADRQAYLKARKENPKLPPRIALLAVSYKHQMAQRHGEAVQVLRRVVQLFPDESADWSELGKELSYFAPSAERDAALKRAGELEQNRNAALGPPVPPTLQTQFEMAAAAGNFREAVRLGDKILLGPGEPSFQLLSSLTFAKLNTGDAKGAVPLVEKLLKLDPHGWQTNRLAGIAFARGGQAERGEKILSEIAKRYPRDALFKNNLAEAKFNANMAGAAEKPAREAIALDPNGSANHGLLAAILTSLERHPEAIAAGREAVRLEPNAAMAWTYLARALGAAGQTREALPAAEKAVALAPDNPLCLGNLGLVLLKAGAWDRATTTYRQAVARKADEAGWWNNLGLSLMKQKRPQEAIAPLEKALTLNPANRIAWLNLAEAAKQTGNRTRAKVAEENARALPAGPDEIIIP